MLIVYRKVLAESR